MKKIITALAISAASLSAGAYQMEPINMDTAGSEKSCTVHKGYYGERSESTGRAKTQSTRGYTKGNGTYVEGYYHSSFKGEENAPGVMTVYYGQYNGGNGKFRTQGTNGYVRGNGRYVQPYYHS